MSRSLKKIAITACLAVAFMASGYSGNASAAVSPSVSTEIVKAQAFKRGKIVDFATAKPAGSIVIMTRAKKLYLIIGGGKAVQYKIATAKPGFEWNGTHKVSMKQQWPDWRPPAEMRKRRPDLPAFMEGGPQNPLGARAIYLGSSIYRIHGTNEPASIGKAASSGCIRMLNADVMELYRNVKLGATVTVL